MENNRFKLWGKWFWIGVVIGFLNAIAGVIYSVALIVEPENRKVGLVLLGWTLLVMVAMAVVFGIVYPTQ